MAEEKRSLLQGQEAEWKEPTVTAVPRSSISTTSSHTFDSEAVGYPSARTRRWSPSSICYLTYIILSHIFFVSAFVAYTRTDEPSGIATSLPHHNSPLRPHVKYFQWKSDPLFQAPNKYNGKPSTENEESWGDLIEPTFFGASESEILSMGGTMDNITRISPNETNGGGYLASPKVYHSIHCLRQLRFFLYKDKYYPHLTEKQHTFLYNHIDHCIESLRQDVMCNADTRMDAWYWDSPEDERPERHSVGEQYCVDWSSIENWMKEHAIPLQPVLIRTEGDEQQIGLR